MEFNEPLEDNLLQTPRGFVCKICLKVFTIKNYPSRTKYSALRHLDIHRAQNVPSDSQQNSERARSPEEPPLFSGEADPDTEHREHEMPIHRSSPATLFGLMSLRFGFSERETDALLRLLKLKLDFSDVRNAKQIMETVGVAEAVERSACRTCELEGIVNGNSSTCASNCENPKMEKYITGDLSQQLANICEDETLFKYSPEKFRTANTIRDVTDGSAYKKNQENFARSHYVDQDEILLTLIVSTDGVKIFESSSQSLWPLFATVSELAPNRRFRNEKIVNYALWQGFGKPPISCIVRNLADEIRQINETGLFVNCADGRKRLYVTAPAITGDLQARHFYLNMVGVGGESCCALCEVEGVRTAKGSGSCRVYPPEAAGRRRTDLSVRESANAAEPDSPVRGFCGLPRIEGLDIDYGTGILLDAMHGVCLGVAKTHVTLLFSGPQRYLTENQRQTANERYRHFHPPPSLKFSPQHITVKQWKASDYRNWVLYYSLPCLKDVLAEEYFVHWCLFVDAFTVLNSSNVREDDLKRAGRQLAQFCDRFVVLFDSNEFGLNFHGLTHLEEMVELWGPLFGYDLFAFESKNGWLTRHSYATHNVTRSLMRPLLGSQVLEKKADKIKLPEEQALVRVVQGKRQRDGFTGTGWRSWSAATALANNAILPPDHGCTNHSLRTLKTAIIRGVTVWTDAYKKPKRSIARYFQITNLFTRVKAFVRVENLVMCTECGDLIFVGTHMRATFWEPNMTVLEPSENPKIVISASNLDLQECVTFLDPPLVQVVLLEKTRYSS